jgi:hypothetical protein
MKGYKGFEKGLVCRGKQYAENTVFEEDDAEICKSGMHFCALPHQVFAHYPPGENHEFAEVEALDDSSTDDNTKYCTKKLRIGARISVFDMVKASVGVFFESVDFSGRIEKTAKVIGAANAGNFGAANAGDYGAANAGDYGAANAGNFGAANAGDYGAANAGHRGAANAGNFGAANAGDYGAANAGHRGAAIARKEGKASVGRNGTAAVIGNGGTVSGKVGAILLLVDTDDYGNTLDFAAVKVDGDKIKENTWYKLESGKIVEVGDDA